MSIEMNPDNDCVVHDPQHRANPAYHLNFSTVSEIIDYLAEVVPGVLEHSVCALKFWQPAVIGRALVDDNRLADIRGQCRAHGFELALREVERVGATSQRPPMSLMEVQLRPGGRRKTIKNRNKAKRVGWWNRLAGRS
ncbi:MAG: hypothetical protein IKE42_28225 [Aquamicrobium sp.]|nr:hypothetical protein [Aquamicrobium sp.]